MMRLSNFLEKTRKDAYLEWVVFAQTALHLLIFFTIGSSFFAALNLIQSIQYGVLVFTCVLLILVWIFYRMFDWYEDIRPMNYGSDKFLKLRKFALLGVACLPIATSWLLNESLYGAINPPGYWREELKGGSASDCQPLQEVLARSAEEFRVIQNKYYMGIATAFEVKEYADSIGMISGLHRDCVAAKEKRREKATHRLNKLLSEK